MTGVEHDIYCGQGPLVMLARQPLSTQRVFLKKEFLEEYLFKSTPYLEADLEDYPESTRKRTPKSTPKRTSENTRRVPRSVSRRVPRRVCPKECLEKNFEKDLVDILKKSS